MTLDKAIEILKELWRYSETDKYTDSQIRGALDLAIKVLTGHDCKDCVYYDRDCDDDPCYACRNNPNYRDCFTED